LARKPTADNLDSPDSAEVIAVDSPDIGKARDVWPMLGEDGAGIRVCLAECDGSHSGSFESETESADAAE
jgi:hypothetical protein